MQKKEKQLQQLKQQIKALQVSYVVFSIKSKKQKKEFGGLIMWHKVMGVVVFIIIAVIISWIGFLYCSSVRSFFFYQDSSPK